MDIKAGELLAITSGEYSDYMLQGHMKALVDFNSEDTRKWFVSELTAEERDQPYSLGDKYISWLIREGFCEPFDGVTEFYLGGYGYELLEGLIDG